MAFPSSNLSLKSATDAYGVSSLLGLVGKTAYNSSGTGQLITSPVTLSTFFGKFSLDPSPLLNQVVTTIPIALPLNKPIPVHFIMTLVGGDGTGGSGGGSNFTNPGGNGGSGGSGATLITGNLRYNSTKFGNISVTLPYSGQGGDAIVIYDNNTYNAQSGYNGGGGGSAAGLINGSQGSNGDGGIPTINGSASFTNDFGTGTNGVSGAGGAGGSGGQPSFGAPGGGSLGNPGSIYISWYFT
jgi:hypothetical protein